MTLDDKKVRVKQLERNEKSDKKVTKGYKAAQCYPKGQPKFYSKAQRKF